MEHLGGLVDKVYPHHTDTPYPCQGCGGYTVPMSAPPVSGSETEETTRLILEAAGEIIATEDFDALSMRRVATTAGVSLSTVVRHFGTKDALLAALVASGGDDVERNEHRARMTPGDVVGAVRIVVDDYEEAGQQ